VFLSRSKAHRKQRCSVETLEARLLLNADPLPIVDDLERDFYRPPLVAPSVSVLESGGFVAQILANSGSPPPPTEPGNDYIEFAAFAEATFGAELEPLAYAAFGNDLVFLGTDYLHVSETSAFIGSETNLPADGKVEYREIGGAVSTVDPSSRYHYLHHHYLTGLLADTPYEYRIVAEDERGNVIESAWQTFTTATPNGGTVTYLSGGTITDAYEITSPGYYVLTGDLVADKTAFKISTSNVTLDLDGHTVTYNEVDFQLPGGDANDYSLNSSHGVWSRWVSNINVYNGTINQGAGENDAQENSIGYSPVHFRNIRGGEVAGISASYAGDQLTGINMHDVHRSAGNDILIHHNTVEDQGNIVTNRHQGAHAINGSGTAHHNLVLRARNRGLQMRRSDSAIPGSTYSNEIYVDSYAANSYGIMYYGFEDDMYDGEVWNNRIFGAGHMTTGIAILLDADGFDVHDNFIHLQSTTPTRESPGDTYGPLSRSVGLRTWGYDPCEGTGGPSCLLTPDTLDFHDNFIAINARDGGDGRGLWLYADTLDDSNFVYDNEIQFMLEDTILDPDEDSGAIVVTGPNIQLGQTTLPPYEFTNNSIRSNFVNVMLGHDYGASSGTIFRDNLIEKTGARSDYRTIQIGYSSIDHKDHDFYETTFAGGAGFDQVEWVNTGGADNNFSVGKSRTLEVTVNGIPISGALVTLTNVERNAVSDFVTNGSGQADEELLHYLDTEVGSSGYTYEASLPIGVATFMLSEADYDLNDVVPVTFVSPPPPPPDPQDDIGIYYEGEFILDSNSNGSWEGSDQVAEFRVNDVATWFGGDWDGDGVDDVGFFRHSQFFLDDNGDGVWEDGVDTVHTFGTAGDVPVVGDWDGDGDDDIGIRRGFRFFLDTNGNGTWDGAAVDIVYEFGTYGDSPISGDWNGDGVDQIGVHRDNEFFFDLNGNGVWDGVGVDGHFAFGIVGDLAVIGDWDGDGVDQVGVRRDDQFELDQNGDGVWDPAVDTTLTFGQIGDLPLAGDWDGDGTTSVGVVQGHEHLLDLNGNGVWDGPLIDFLSDRFAHAGSTPLIGDWDGDGLDDVGLHLGYYFYLDLNANDVWDGPAIDGEYAFGTFGDLPVVGDWDGDGIDQIGIHRGYRFFLDLNGSGAWDGGDVIHAFGTVGDTPLIGDWDGDETDNIGVHRGFQWFLDFNGNGVWDGVSLDLLYAFGTYGDDPLTGDWDGSGLDKIGIYRDGIFILDEDGDGLWDPALDSVHTFGPLGRQISGVWT